MIARFKAAFGRALPQLPRKELSWRLHFIMGALSYTLAGTDALKLIAELKPAETDNDELLLHRLAPFLLAGLKAPLPDLATRRVDARTREASTACSTHRCWIAAVALARGRSAHRAATSTRPGVAFTAAIAVALGVAWLAHTIPAGLTLALHARVRAARDRAERAAAAAQLISDRRARRVPQGDAADVADRARSDRRRHRLVGRRALLRQAGLAASCSRFPQPTLTAEEQRFLDHDVEELCAMVDDWETTHVYTDLPPHVWQFIKDKGFLGMIIPKEYGGLGFSALRAFAGDDQALDALGHRVGDA